MLYLLDKDVKTVKWNGIPLHEASSAIVKEEVNGDFVLTVRYPITDSGIYQLIKEDMLIKAPVPVLGAQLFRIKKPVENDDSLDITAYHISDDVMQRSINPMSVVRVGCFTALSRMVQNAKTGLGIFSFTSDIADNHTFTTDKAATLYTVLMDGKHSIVGTWEGELVRDNFALSVKQSRGADRGVVITTHKNLKSYQRTKNSQSVVTRIHARSTFRAEGAENDTVLTVTVDSPLIGSYPYINEREYENNDAKTVDELRKWAEAKFKNEGIDKVSDAIEIEAYELDGQVVHLGDTVNIKSWKHGVDVYKKAIAYEYNALTKEYISLTFDDKPGVGGSGVASGVSGVADAILGASANAQEVAIERAIRNANQAFDAEFDKRVESINDGIERSKAEAELYADNIKRSIDTEIAQVNQSMQAQSEEHDRRVAAILSKTQSIESLTNQAKTDAANALDRANQVKTEAIADARAQVATVSQALNTAKSELQTAIASADQKARDSQASATALTNRVTTIETLVDGTRSTVAELSRTMQEATQDIASVSSRTRAVEDTLSQTRTRYEAMTQTVNTQTGQIESINRKTADLQSGIDGVTERFENLRVGGRNLIPGTAAFSGTHWENYGTLRLEDSLYKGAGVLTWVSGPKASPLANISVQSGDTYTFSAYIKKASQGTVYFYLYDTGETRFATANVPRETLIRNVGDSFQRFSITFTITRSGILRPRFAIVASDTGGFSVAGYQLESGTVATDWSPAFEDQQSYTDTKLAEYRASVDGRFTTLQTSLNGKANQADFQRVQETSQLYERVIGSTETGIKDKVARMVMADSGFREEVLDKVKGTYTTVTHLADSWAVQNLTSAGDVLGQINLNSDGSVRLNDSLISIGNQTIIEDGVIKNAMIGDLDAGKITTGTLDADRIKANSIDGSKIVFDEAFFTGLTANQANLKTLFAKNAFITSVQAVTLSASQITSGSLKASNNNMAIHLDEAEIEFKNNAKIRFLSSDNSISRTTPGLPKQFLKFETGQFVQYGKTKLASRLVLGSNSDNVENAETDRFSGQRWWQARDGASMGELVANQVLIYSNGTHRGPLVFNTGGSVKSIHPTAGSSWDIGLNEAKFRYMHVYDIYLQNGTRLGRALKDLANRVGHNGWADNLS